LNFERANFDLRYVLHSSGNHYIDYRPVLSLSQSCLVRKAGEVEGEVRDRFGAGSFLVGWSIFGGATKGADAGVGGGAVCFGVD